MNTRRLTFTDTERLISAAYAPAEDLLTTWERTRPPEAVRAARDNAALRAEAEARQDAYDAWASRQALGRGAVYAFGFVALAGLLAWVVAAVPGPGRGVAAVVAAAVVCWVAGKAATP